MYADSSIEMCKRDGGVIILKRLSPNPGRKQWQNGLNETTKFASQTADGILQCCFTCLLNRKLADQ